MKFRNYEDLSFAYDGVRQAYVAEYYSGEGIVGWHGNIERQIDRMISTFDSAKNTNYVDKLRAFINVWRQHALSGSINVENIDSLLAACEVLGVDSWNLKDYFSNLRDQLRRLKASEEELPPMGGTGPEFGGRSPSGSTMTGELPTEFGPDASKIDSPDADALPPSEGSEGETSQIKKKP